MGIVRHKLRKRRLNKLSFVHIKQIKEAFL